MSTESEISRLINEQEITYFLEQINELFPSCIATVIADNDGFLIASKFKGKHKFDEKMLALQAVSEKRDIMNLKGYNRYRKPISEDVNLFLVLRKNRHKLANYNKLTTVLRNNSLF